MSSETWALVGVVVGAVLGALAQIITDRLRRNHDNSMLVRNERRDAYTEFLAATTAALAPLATARSVFDAPIEEPHRQSAADDLNPSGHALNRLSVALARVHLTAPGDTHAAAISVHVATLAFMFKDEDGMVERLVGAQTEFSRLAKSDLRVPLGAPT